MRLLLLLFLTITIIGCNETKTTSYKDAALPVEERVKDLLSQMTLEEKVAQLTSTMPMLGFDEKAETSYIDKDGKFNPEAAAAFFKHGIGQISRPGMMLGPKEMAELTNTVQKWIIENTRLGIPVMFHEEALHGLATAKATSFPQAIALASSWNPELVNEVYTVAALETRSRGAQQVLSPVLDIARDPRWGRVEETYGEDPYLASRMGVASITGFQGNSAVIDKSHVIATGKHFAVHGQPVNGINVGPANYSERVIREFFLKPFEAAVKEANLQSMMPSYNEIDGLPSHANIKLLDGILRQEWGFKGHTVSDYYGIKELKEKHHVAVSKEDAAKQAIEAGVDIELPYTEIYDRLVDLVKNGIVSEKAVDKCVARVLRSKFITGLFDDPYVDPDYAVSVYENPDHKALALKAAKKSIILLKNENNVLPLTKDKYKKIAVIGPNAKGAHIGNYSGTPEGSVGILKGMKNRAAADQEILYAEGCKITETDPTVFTFEEPRPGDPEKNKKRIKEAVKVAKNADVIVLALGGNEFTSREAWIGHLGDRDSLELLGNQNDLVKEMVKLKKPMVVFLIHGRPNNITYVEENVQAILEGWYLGQEGGNAAADVLFGNYNPGGKLTISIPRSVGQIPVYYNYKPTARRGYMGSTTEPLYPFGWGLSYTTFKYNNLKLSKDKIGLMEKVTVSFDVTNTGKVKGDEVTQLYIRDEVSSITRPVKELKRFKRITLEPGETKRVEFTIGPEELSFLNRDMHKVVEPGTFKIMAGGNSKDLIEVTLEAVDTK